MLELFLKYLRFEKRYSDHTVSSYKIDLEQFVNFIKEELNLKEFNSVNHKTARSWIINLSSEKLAPTTINRKIASVKSFYKYLISREKLNENPFKKITLLKKEKKLPKFIKEKDIKIMFDQSKFENNLTDIRNLLILELLYGTGIRLSELINLKIKDCDLNKSQIKVLGKRNKERIVPINKNIKYQLEKYLILRTEKEINQLKSEAKNKINALEKSSESKLLEQIEKRKLLADVRIDQLLRDTNSSIKDYISNAAIEATTNILNKNLTKEKKSELIEESVKDLKNVIKN